MIDDAKLASALITAVIGAVIITALCLIYSRCEHQSDRQLECLKAHAAIECADFSPEHGL